MDHYYCLCEEIQYDENEFGLEYIQISGNKLYGASVQTATQFEFLDRAMKKAKELKDTGMVTGKLFIVPVSIEFYENFDQKVEV